MGRRAKGTHHGLPVTLLLLVEFDCLLHDTLRDLYPTFGDMRTALLTSFQTDRVFKEPCDEEVQYVPPEKEINIPWTLLGSVGLPLGFARAHEYYIMYGCLDQQEVVDSHGLLTTCIFCNAVVLPDFDGEATNYEHVLLALQMLPPIFASLQFNGDTGDNLDKRKMMQLTNAATAFI